MKIQKKNMNFQKKNPNFQKKNMNFKKKNPKTWKKNTQLTKPQNNGEKEQNRKRPVRVPAIYAATAKLLKKVKEGAGLKDALYQINHPNLRGIYALACKAIQNKELLETIITETGLLNEKSDLDLTKILVTELLWGKQELKGDSIPVKVTLEHEEALRTAVKEASIPVVLSQAVKPLRYARINTLLVTVTGTIQRLIDDGWQLEDTPETYQLFLKRASKLGENQFMKDYHLDDVLVFPPKSNIEEHKLVANGSLLLQDKASCLPAVLLDPKPGGVVLDMCAAPGMKTSQLANIMQNKGILFAVDRDPKRFEQMHFLVERNCRKHNCVNMKLADSVQLTSEDCPGVQYILIDPSCTGSGMTSRIESQSQKEVTPSGRLRSLSTFQERLLVQAMTAFPDVERIVYSTCSLFKEENEEVLAKALSRVPSFQVVSPQLKKPWERRGSPEYPFGSDCLVADKDKDKTNGFFVAVLERIPGSDSPSVKAKSKKRKSTTLDDKKDGNKWEVPKKKKKAKQNKKMQVDDDQATSENNV